MKKLLLAVVAALIGWTTAAASITAGQPYRLRHNATGAYFNMEKTGYGDNRGRNCASLQTLADASTIYFVQNPSVSNQWQIRLNSEDGFNLSTNSDWNSIINSSDSYYWEVAEDPSAENGVYFIRTGTQKKANSQQNYLGPNPNTGAGQPIYSNQDGAQASYKASCLWILEPISENDYDVTLTVNLGANQSATYTLGIVSQGATYTPPTVYDEVLTISGAPTGAVDGPVELQGTLKNGILPFKLANATNQTRWAISGSNGLASTGDNFAFADGGWYLEVPNADGSFKIFCLEYGKYFKAAAAANTTPVPFAANASEAASFTMTRDASGAETISTGSVSLNQQHSPQTGYVICYKEDLDINSYFFQVYDQATFNTNKTTYYSSTNSLTALPNGTFKQALDAAQAKYEATKDVESLSTATAELKTAIDAMAEVRFGKSTDIATKIANLNSAIAEINTALGPDYLALQAAITALANHSLGTGVGQYNNTTGDLADKYTAAQAVLANLSSTNEQFAAAAASIAANTWSLNMPEIGKYYRLKGYHQSTATYLSSTTTTWDDKTGGEMTTQNGPQTVFVYDGHNLIAYANGKALTTCNLNNLGYELQSDATNIADIEFIGSNRTPGAYFIKTGSSLNDYNGNTQDFYIYNATSGHIDRGGFSVGVKPEQANLNDTQKNGYEWTFEEVTWLPIYCENVVGHTTSFYTTMELKKDENRFKAYTLKLDGDHVVKTPVTGNIPANTPLLMEVTKVQDEQNFNQGGIWLEVNRGAASANQVESNMSGTIAAASNDNAYVYSIETGKFVPATEAIRGFRPYATFEGNASELVIATKATHDDAETITFNDDKTITFSHTGGALGVNTCCDNHKITLTPLARAAAVEIDHNHQWLTANDNGTFTLDMSRAENGQYTLEVQPGFFTVGDNNVSKGTTAEITVSDGNVSSINGILVESGAKAIYDLQGRRLAAPQKGINIIGGRKVLVK